MNKAEANKQWERIEPRLLVHIMVHYNDIIQNVEGNLLHCNEIINFVEDELPDYKYSDIYAFLILNRDKIDNLMKRVSKDKAITFKNGNIVLTNYGLSLVRKMYPFIRKWVRSSIDSKGLFPDINTKVYDDWTIRQELYKFLQFNNSHIQSALDIQMGDAEVSHIYRNFVKIYLNTFVKYIQEYSETHFKMEEPPYKSRIDQFKSIFKKVHFKLSEYLNDTNLRKIFTKLQLTHKYDPEMYDASWLDMESSLDNGIEYKLIYNYLMEHKDELLKQFGFNYPISNELFADILKSFLNDHRKDIVYKIYKLIMLKNRKVRIKRSQDLLNLQDDDKIGVKHSIIIDFDITSGLVRDRPIIIIEDANTHQPYVFFGEEGQSHGTFINSELDKVCEKENIIQDPNKFGYGYLLGSIAFIDEDADLYQKGYTNNDVVNILKKDPRIKKIYTTPPEKGKGGPITRLAKRRK